MRSALPSLMATVLCIVLIAINMLPNKEAVRIGQLASSPNNKPTEKMQLQSDFEISLQDKSQIIAQIADRPLFSEDRRKHLVSLEEEESTGAELIAPPVAPLPLPPKPQPPQLQLRGFLKSTGITTALVLLIDSQEERWVSIGDKIEGWKVVEINARSVVLSGYNTQHVVETLN